VRKKGALKLLRYKIEVAAKKNQSRLSWLSHKKMLRRQRVILNLAWRFQNDRVQNKRGEVWMVNHLCSNSE